jgi:hypothetical protein
MSQLFLVIIWINLWQIEGLKDWGIEELRN